MGKRRIKADKYFSTFRLLQGKFEDISALDNAASYHKPFHPVVQEYKRHGPRAQTTLDNHSTIRLYYRLFTEKFHGRSAQPRAPAEDDVAAECEDDGAAENAMDDSAAENEEDDGAAENAMDVGAAENEKDDGADDHCIMCKKKHTSFQISETTHWVECDMCQGRAHAMCVGFPTQKEDEEWLCPFCVKKKEMPKGDLSNDDELHLYLIELYKAKTHFILGGPGFYCYTCIRSFETYRLLANHKMAFKNCRTNAVEQQKQPDLLERASGDD